jgi:hypothetical protein
MNGKTTRVNARLVSELKFSPNEKRMRGQNNEHLRIPFDTIPLL